MDGHYSHVYNLELVEFCMAKQILLLVLPSGQTARLQPFDSDVFGVFKSDWKRHQNAVDLTSEVVTFLL